MRQDIDSLFYAQAVYDVNNFSHVLSILKADDGDKGGNKDCHGKNANHKIVKVPVGTIIKNYLGRVVGDLDRKGLMFVAARGGAGGKGNHFFISDADNAPKVCEYGAPGEDLSYTLELRSMAHIGLVSAKQVVFENASIGIVSPCLDRLTKCGQKHSPAGDHSGQTQSGRLPIHHAQTPSRHGRIRRLCANFHC